MEFKMRTNSADQFVVEAICSGAATDYPSATSTGIVPSILSAIVHLMTDANVSPHSSLRARLEGCAVALRERAFANPAIYLAAGHSSVHDLGPVRTGV